MKTILLLVSALFITSNHLFAQSIIPPKSPDFKYIDADAIGNFNDGVSVVTKGKSIGLINSKGNFIIPYNKYSSISNSKDGIIVAFSNNVWVMLNDKAEIIYQSKGGIYLGNPDIYNIHDGYMSITMDNNDKVGGTRRFVNSAGKQFTLPNWKNLTNGRYEYGQLSEGLVMFNYRFDDANKQIKQKIGYSDYSGKTVIEPIFDEGYDFSDSLALVGKKDEFGKLKYGFIDKTGKLVIPLMYTNKPSNFNSEFSLVVPINQDELIFGYINKNNEMIFKFSKENLQATAAFGEAFKDGFAKISYVAASTSDVKEFYIDTTGKHFTSEEIKLLDNPLSTQYQFLGKPDPVTKFRSVNFKEGNDYIKGVIDSTGSLIFAPQPKNLF